MPLHLDPRERALRYRFEGGDRLYRDHLGRRVIGDVEGRGYYAVKHSAPTTIEVDESAVDATQGAFQSSLLVAASGEGWVDLRVALGRSGPVDGEVEGAESVVGAGWVVEASGPLFVDDRFEASPEPTAEFPVPFFRGAFCGHGLRFVRAATECSLLDRFSIGDQAALGDRSFRVQNISAITELTCEFGDGSPSRGPVASHLNAASWRLRVGEVVDGILLRKTYDRFHGRQRARVFVDGQFAGWWYEPGENRSRRWAVSDFGIGPELIRSPGEVELTIDPPAGSALWSVSLIEAFGLRQV